MKKGTLVLVASILALSSLASPVFAESFTEKESKKIEQVHTQDDAASEEVVEVYEDVTFSSPDGMTEEQMAGVLEMVENTPPSVESRTVLKADEKQSTTMSVALAPEPENVYVPSSPYSGTITIGPYYRTYSNMETRAAISAFAWVLTTYLKMPNSVSAGISGSTFGTTEWIVTPKYVGSWRYKAWDPNVSRYREFQTVVHYKYGNYTSPYRVQTYPMFYY